MRTVGILVVVAVSLVSFHARGDSARAWTAAKAGLPADAKLVIGVDFAAIQKTQLFHTYYPKLREQPEAAKLLDVMKDSCKIDPLTTVRGVVVATSGDQREGAVYLALAGTDRARLQSCLVGAARAANSTDKVSIKQDGNITQLTENTETSYFGWVGKDVVVVAIQARDKAALVKWMGGKGAFARSELARSLAKVNVAGTVWGAGEVAKELQPGITSKGAYGTVTFANGTVDADLHGVLSSPDQATTLASAANKQLATLKQGGALPPPVIALIQAITIAAAKDEIVIKASVGEKDLTSALTLAISGTRGP